MHSAPPPSKAYQEIQFKKEANLGSAVCASANTKALASSEFIIWLTTPGDAAPGNY